MPLKYSFMSFSCPHLNLDDMLALAKRVGYDAIELRLECNHAHGIEVNASSIVRHTTLRKCSENDIPICCVATSCRLSDAQIANQQVELAHRCIDLAGDIGATRLRVFGGGIPAGISRADAISTMVESLLLLSDHAQQRAVAICVETHDDWCDPAHLVAVMQRVNHACIAINWDIMHPVRQAGVTIDQAFTMLQPWIQHVHFHDGLTSRHELVLTPIGQGEIDHRRAVKLLRAMNYDGYLSGEWIDWEPYETHLPRELAVMKSYES